MSSNPVAHEEFEHARSKAFWNEVSSWITGKSNTLLPFDEIRKRLPFEGQHYLGLQAAPVEQIVGSVGRYRDFDRAFLPKQRQTQYRWESIHAAREDGVLLPPVDLYKIGDVYFVKDGNHRVSVARAIGQTYIDAYVTEIDVSVAITPESNVDEIIRQQEYAAFLHQTRLSKIRPEVAIQLSAPGQYEKLLEHIAVHRWYMGEQRQAEIPYEEAVASWVDNVYLPLVQIIRERQILQHFPDRTEADLYLWISEHRAELEEDIGWYVDPATAAADLTEQFSAKPERVASRIGKKLLQRVLPDELSGGPAPGSWRQERLTARPTDRFFIDILVAINGEEGGWGALDHALTIAQREHSYLHGLHVVPTSAHLEFPEVQAVKATFEQRCAEAGVPGKLFLETGEAVATICTRARWADLVVVSLNYPPPPQALARLGSGFRNLLHRVPRPVLAIPKGVSSSLERPLLAYDGSPAADEALFIAAHLAARWQLPLTVVTSGEATPARATTLARAVDYLRERAVVVEGIEETGAPAKIIRDITTQREANLIIMGSYGLAPMLEVVLGSTVDQILREARQPILICR